MSERGVMEAWQQRVLDERKDLDEKIFKLKNYMRGYIYRSLPKVDSLLLQDQKIVMEQYLRILDKRITRFGVM